MSLSKQRISDVEIADLDFSLLFRGKTHKISVLRTCFGDYLVRVTSLMMLACESEEKAAINHFYKISKRCDPLKHENAKLKDHIKVIFI
jgi:hypothetical protein